MGSARGAWSPGFLPPSFVCVRVFPHLGSVKGRVRPCPTPGDPSHAAPEPLAEWGRSPHPTRTPPLRSGDGQRVVGGYGFLTSFTPWKRGEKCHGNESWVKVWSGGTAEFSSRFRRFVVRRSAPVLPGGPVWFPPLEVEVGESSGPGRGDPPVCPHAARCHQQEMPLEVLEGSVGTGPQLCSAYLGQRGCRVWSVGRFGCGGLCFVLEALRELSLSSVPSVWVGQRLR